MESIRRGVLRALGAGSILFSVAHWLGRILDRWAQIEFALGKVNWLVRYIPTLRDVLASTWLEPVTLLLGLLLIWLSYRPNDPLKLLRADGQRLLNEIISEEQFSDWWQRVNRWRDSVVSLLEHRHADADVREFNGPQEVHVTKRYEGPFVNESHEQLLGDLRDRLERLDEIIKRHKRAARLSLLKRI